MAVIAELIDRVLSNLGTRRRWKPRCAREVQELTGRFPLYPTACAERARPRGGVR